MSEEDFSPFSGPSYGHADFENSSGSEGRGGNTNDYDFESDRESPKAPSAAPRQTDEDSSHRVGIFGDSEEENEDNDAYTEYTDWEDESATSPHQESTEVLEASTRGLDSFVVEPSQESLEEPSTFVAPGNASVAAETEEYSDDAVSNGSEGEQQDGYPDSEDYQDEDQDNYSDDDFDEASPTAASQVDHRQVQLDPVQRYVSHVIRKAAVHKWPDVQPKPAETAEAEGGDEIAAIIAAARAAVDRPAAASTSAIWDDREMEAAAPSPGKQAVQFGPVGTPPPDDAQPRWVRDTNIQCGLSCVLSEFKDPPRDDTPVFSAARPPGAKREAPEVQSEGIQTQASNLSMPHRGSEFVRSLSSGPLETVDEGECEETSPTPPAEKKAEAAEAKAAEKVTPGYPSQSDVSSRPAQPRASSEKRNRSREPRSPPRSLSPAQPLRTLLPHEQEALYSGLSQAPSSSLAFGRRLQGRRPTPPGSQEFSWSEELSCDHPSAIIAPIPAGHLHRICDPFAKRARPVWLVNRSSSPRSSEHVRRIKPLPKGFESRPPEAVEPDIRTEVHSVMAQRRAKDWLMADNLQLRHTATEQDFRKRSVAAGAVYYAKPSKSCLQSLGAGGNFPGGRR